MAITTNTVGVVKRVAVIGAGARCATNIHELEIHHIEAFRHMRCSGLTAIKEMLKQGFQVTAFEGKSPSLFLPTNILIKASYTARPQVGGAWIYTPKSPGECIVSFDKHGRPFPQTKKAKESKGKYPTVLDPTPMYRLR